MILIARRHTNIRSAFFYLSPVVMALFVPATLQDLRAETLDIRTGIALSYNTNFSAARKDGMGVHLDGALGITDTLSFSLDGGISNHTIGNGQEYSKFHAACGFSYALDILEIIPTVALHIGWLQERFDFNTLRQGLAIFVTIGADYLLFNDRWTIGFAAEYGGLVSNFRDFPAQTAFMVRLGWAFFR
jgi:hypothetical protein